MTPASIPPRIHFLAARHASVVVVLARVRSKHVHVLRWNTADDTLEPGSWFRGRIHAERCDLSFDGQWMVYFAVGADGTTAWTGICRPPWLATFRSWEGCGTWFGGGVWVEPERLVLDADEPVPRAWWRMRASGQDDPAALPFALESSLYRMRDGVLAARMRRNGWTRDPHPPLVARSAAAYPFAAWSACPTRAHPRLHLSTDGTAARHRFSIDTPHVQLGADVTWAEWDAFGFLIVARSGRLERYSLADLERGEPSQSHDLRALAPPLQRDEPPSPR